MALLPCWLGLCLNPPHMATPTCRSAPQDKQPCAFKAGQTSTQCGPCLPRAAMRSWRNKQLTKQLNSTTQFTRPALPTDRIPSTLSGQHSTVCAKLSPHGIPHASLVQPLVCKTPTHTSCLIPGVTPNTHHTSSAHCPAQHFLALDKPLLLFVLRHRQRAGLKALHPHSLLPYLLHPAVKTLPLLVLPVSMATHLTSMQ